MKSYEKILEHVSKLHIIDTHEHLVPEKEWALSENDVLAEWLSQYASSDLVSAGLRKEDLEKVHSSSITLSEKWRIVESFWRAAGNTGYFRSLAFAARDLYGISKFSADSIAEIDAGLRARRKESLAGKSYYRSILKDRSRISVSLLDYGNRFVPEGGFFRSVMRPYAFMMPDAAFIAKASETHGIKVRNLQDWKDVYVSAYSSWKRKGAVALKCGSAYHRPLYFPEVPGKDAAAIFRRIIGGGASRPDDSKLHDHMMHFVLSLADADGFPFQIHTGLQEGNGNYIQNSNPEFLSNLFMKYENVNFDIFHISYPYHHTLGALAKIFPNVSIDMCWAHIISPETSVRILSEYLDSVPANKISAFGGDYRFIDGVYGHQLMARQNVARTLSMKVDEGVFDLDRAREIAEWLFISNPKRIFKLPCSDINKLLSRKGA